MEIGYCVMAIKKRVMVAMSGGVDSAVAALLLVRQGCEVIGATMCFSAFGEEVSNINRRRPSCCDLSGIEDARKTANFLGIRHYVFNFAKALEQEVIKDFCLEYLGGRTPNPCVKCNRFLKFGLLLKKARALSCDYLATGHYARITRNPSTKGFLLRKGRDIKKDQSYFLYALDKGALNNVLFPLGDYTKEEVRAEAARFKLPVAEKPASQEICFIPSDDYRKFILKYINQKITPGLFRHIDGRILGEHKGLPFYTIGQRRNLGAGGGHKTPLYVIKIDNASNSIILGGKEHTYSQGLIANNLNFLTKVDAKKIIAIKTKIRYNHQEVKSRLIPINKESARVEFSLPQRAVTPGQSAVFYSKDTVLGGGIIRESI